MQPIVPVFRAMLYVFAATLIASAWLKAGNPNPAVVMLVGHGVSDPIARHIVDLAVAGEAIMGSSIIVAGSLLYVRLAAGLAALGLIVLRVSIVWGGGIDCGCFGGTAIPDSIVLGALVMGIIGVITPWPRLTEVHALRRVLWGAVLACAALAPITWREPELSTPEDHLMATIGTTKEDLAARVIVGAVSCEDCHRAVEEAIRDGDDVVFVTRADERGPSPFGEPVTLVSIDSDLWWALLDGPPPRVILPSR